MLAQVAALFTQLDTDMLARQTEWAFGRRTALRALIAELAPQRRTMGEWAYYDKLFALCGGKTWYGVVNGASETAVREFVAKNCAAIAEKRNAKIVAKLEKCGVTSVDGLRDATYTTDGFHGRFFFDTAAGRKSVEIRTIVAGGYNIQCAHQRTLVNVK